MNKQRQRQRMSRRMVLLVAGTFVVAATVTTTLIIQMSDQRESMARDVVDRPIHMVQDWAPVNDFTIAAPLLNPKMPGANEARFMRKLKPVNQQ